MKIYDIFLEVFSCAVYPGDPKPEKRMLCATEKGDLYNLSVSSMCAYNGTHVDAPFHFLTDGGTLPGVSSGYEMSYPNKEITLDSSANHSDRSRVIS